MRDALGRLGEAKVLGQGSRTPLPQVSGRRLVLVRDDDFRTRAEKAFKRVLLARRPDLTWRTKEVEQVQGKLAA